MEEVFGLRPAWEQLKFLWAELVLLTNGKKERWLVLFFEPSAGVIISYRLDRSGYLLSGRGWTLLRLLILPVLLFLRVLSCRHEICFKAEIGCGLRIMHPTLGAVVHGDAIIGRNCLLTGGNSIGSRKPIKRGDLIVGDDVQIGINACVLGPVVVGNRVGVGAGAMVVSDIPDDSIAIGEPARFKLKPL